MRKIALILSVCTVAVLSHAAGSVVKIEGGEGAWRLTVNGEPFFINGGGGGGSKALLKAIGGNSFRTWGANRAREELDEARRYGHTVMLGFWLGHHNHGFSYLDTAALARTEREVLATVAAIKDHPALLCYALGNEMELGEPHPKEMWTFINTLAEKVRAADPNHPVGTVVADMWKEKAEAINRYAPALQYIGLNAYGGACTVGRRWRELGGKLPYILTEYGPRGANECGKAPNGMPLEWTSTRKAAWYREIYEKTILADKGTYCLGGYLFTWGHKNEISPTWFGALLPDGTKLEAVATLAALWGHPVANRCPAISAVTVSNDAPAPDETVTATVTATDPEGDPLTWRWTLVDEAATYGEAGLGLALPEGWDEAIVAGQDTPTVKVRLPGGGKYRLYAYCFDGKDNAAYANWPLVGKGPKPKKSLKPVAMPYPVYGDGTRGPWHISGYMGNTAALHVDDRCASNPHTGATCLKVTYSARDNWAGIFWQSPANDWGDRPGGVNLSKALTLVFWARGEKGGERVSFFMGGLKDKPFSDTANRKLEDLKLKPVWTRYRIPLDGEDLSQIKTGFGFNLGGQGVPLTFYLDDIRYTEE
ncbi:MAG: hypothetical protein J6334_12795 [Kiritimatiellae bacterium]|nr:hypothetical protein [Kiritimatiellia bacterium]